MTAATAIVVTLLAAYLVGAIPFGYLVARWRGVDILHQGSGNIGATNVGRVLGRRFGILVFLLDFAKGALPVAAALALGPRGDGDWPGWLGPHGLGVFAGLAAFLGHLFPVYLRFRGGKGVATATGVVVVLLPVPALASLLAWVAVVSSTRYVSLASMVSAVVLCVAQLALVPQPFSDGRAILSVFCLLAAGLIILRHHANIHRLLHGTENRLPDKPIMFTLAKTIHVLALGLWFGAMVFFTFVVGLTLFSTFDALTATDRDRPLWLPVPEQLRADRPSPRFPKPLTKEQGSRIAGAAVGPMFPWYFRVQAVCALLAWGTALGWSAAPAGRVHRWRTSLLGLALLTVAVGWWLEREVEALRVLRTETSDAVLQAARPIPEDLLAAADRARAEFGAWHGYSLLANFATLLLVTIAMALAAQLPTSASKTTANLVTTRSEAESESGAVAATPPA